MNRTVLTLCAGAVIALGGCQGDDPADPAVGPSEPTPNTPATPQTPDSLVRSANATGTQVSTSDPSPPANYLQRATSIADQQLQSASEGCAQLQAHLQDDCVTSAHTQHESALAAARVEFEAQLAEQEQNGEDEQ